MSETLQIEAGKRYVARDGYVTSPMQASTSNENFPWQADLFQGQEIVGHGMVFRDNGRYLVSGDHSLDLMREVAETPARPQPQTPPASAPNIRRETLEAALSAVCGDRNLNYGSAEDNFRRIVDLWNVYLDGRAQPGPITPTDQACMMVLLKIARLQNTPNHRDSWVDIAGYAACGAEVAEGEKK